MSPVSIYGPRAAAIKNVVQASEEDIKTDVRALKAARVVSSDAQRITV